MASKAMPPLSRGVIAGALVVLGLCVIGATALVWNELRGGSRPVTMRHFDAIELHRDTYPDVVKLIGRPGIEVSRHAVGSGETRIVVWSNPDGAVLECTFRDNLFVTAKRQRGLR